jgi:hypothetical protein
MGGCDIIFPLWCVVGMLVVEERSLGGCEYYFSSVGVW